MDIATSATNTSPPAMARYFVVTSRTRPPSPKLEPAATCGCAVSSTNPPPSKTHFSLSAAPLPDVLRRCNRLNSMRVFRVTACEHAHFPSFHQDRPAAMDVVPHHEALAAPLFDRGLDRDPVAI